MSGIPNVPTQKAPDIERRFGQAINHLLNDQHPFVELSAAPVNPTEGQAYYNKATHKAYVWDGTAWNALW